MHRFTLYLNRTSSIIGTQQAMHVFCFNFYSSIFCTLAIASLASAIIRSITSLQGKDIIQHVQALTAHNSAVDNIAFNNTFAVGCLYP